MIGVHKTTKSLLDRVRPALNEPHERKLLKKIEKSQIGYDSAFQGPFGVRRGKRICVLQCALSLLACCVNPTAIIMGG